MIFFLLAHLYRLQDLKLLGKGYDDIKCGAIRNNLGNTMMGTSPYRTIMNRWKNVVNMLGTIWNTLGTSRSLYTQGLVSLHFRESKANLLTHEHVKMLHTTNQPTNLNHLMWRSWFFTVENVSYIFNPMGHRSSTWRWREIWTCPWWTHSLSTQYTQWNQQLPLNGRGMCLLWAWQVQHY